MRIIRNILLFVIFCGCQSDKQTKNVPDKISENLINGNWNESNSDALLKIFVLNNKNFAFQSNMESISLFANGTWNIQNDTLYLNSKMPTECLYVEKFGPNCRNPNLLIEEKIETTVEDCMPIEIKRYFMKFSNEKFIIRNDSLIHIPNCKNAENIKFHR